MPRRAFQWRFKIAVSDSRGGMMQVLLGDYVCLGGPESRNRTRKGSMVAEIAEKYYAPAHSKERRVTFEIAVSDSRGGMMPALVGDYGCSSGPESRRRTRKGSVVAEIVEKYCVCRCRHIAEDGLAHISAISVPFRARIRDSGPT